MIHTLVRLGAMGLMVLAMGGYNSSVVELYTESHATFDPAKDLANQAKHGLSLADAVEFDLAGALVERDDRKDYGEVRYRAFGRIAKQGYCLVFTYTGSAIRIISFRRAHEKEMRRYDQ